MQRNHHAQSGAALPICLALAAIIALSAAQSLRSAQTESMLAGATGLAYRSFALAEAGLSEALKYADQHPGSLPTSTEQQSISVSSAGVEVTVAELATDAVCPEFEHGERRHYEIHSKPNNGIATDNLHVQGFYICAELCPTPGCTAAVSAPVFSYWTTVEASSR